MFRYDIKIVILSEWEQHRIFECYCRRAWDKLYWVSKVWITDYRAIVLKNKAFGRTNDLFFKLFLPKAFPGNNSRAVHAEMCLWKILFGVAKSITQYISTRLAFLITLIENSECWKFCTWNRANLHKFGNYESTFRLQKHLNMHYAITLIRRSWYLCAD